MVDQHEDTGERLAETEKKIDGAIKEWCEVAGVSRCYPLLLVRSTIRNELVDDVFDDLRTEYGESRDKLDVIVHSSGGDIDAAYNLALLFRRYATEQLRFVVPRWAKSAATLLACAGDSILMTPVAELGPLDPQITEMNPLERRFEQFSPLHIGAAMELIRDEYSSGNEKLADKLIDKLQFPLTSGRYRSSINIGTEYLCKLLSMRMLADNPEKAKRLANQLATGYSDHGYCIDVQEAISIGLVACELEGRQMEVAWSIYRLAQEREDLLRLERQKRLKERGRAIPAELLETLGEDHENEDD